MQVIESCTTDSGDLLLKWCDTLGVAYAASASKVWRPSISLSSFVMVRLFVLFCIASAMSDEQAELVPGCRSGAMVTVICCWRSALCGMDNRGVSSRVHAWCSEIATLVVCLPVSVRWKMREPWFHALKSGQAKSLTELSRLEQTAWFTLLY